MARNKNEFPDLKKEVNRYTATVLNKGVLPGVEEVVKELQHLGPSWTGRYSNSWQIIVGKEKSTGTKRPGNPQPVKAPKMNVRSIREGRISRDEINIEIRNLAESKEYAEDKKQGRFRRGKVKGRGGVKVIGNEPRTAKGKSKFEETGGGRGGFTMRGEIGGGDIKYVSSRTAELDWLPKYLRGGSLQQTIKLELNNSIKKAKGKKLK